MHISLSDELVTLRALEPSDLELLYDWENWEENWIISHTLTPFSRYNLTQYIQEAARDIYETKQLRLMIDTKSGETVGAIDLFDFDPLNSRAGVGILIQNREDRYKGYGSSALRLLIGYCFQHLHLHQLYANILCNNTASCSLFSNSGFEIAGTKKQWIRIGDEFVDEYLMQLIKKG